MSSFSRLWVLYQSDHPNAISQCETVLECHLSTNAMEGIVQDPSQELDPEELDLIDEGPDDEDAIEDEANEEVGEDAIALRAEVMREAHQCASTKMAASSPP